MLRHELALNPAVWLAARKPVKGIEGRWPADGWQVLRSGSGHSGRFRVTLSRDAFEVAGEITPPRGWDASNDKLHPEWFFHDHVCLFLDPGHDHATRRTLTVMRDGELRAEDAWCFQGEEISDIYQSPLKLAPLKPRVRVAEVRAGWRVLVRIARRRLRAAATGRQQGGPLGLHIRFGHGGKIVYPAASWPPEDRFWGVGPFAFGDLLEHAAPLTVTGVDFGKPVWKTAEVVSRVRISGRFTRAAAPTARGRCRIGIVHTDGRRTVETHAWKAAGRKLTVDLPVPYPFQSKWAPALAKTAHLEIALLGPRDEIFWRAEYPFGFDGGIIVREPFGLLGKSAAGARRPKADDPEFIEHYRAWLLRRLPAWRWATTREGAPSDFYLRARRRADDIDLMSPSVLTKLARLIRRKFPDWQAGLCAAAMLLHHPRMTVHSSSWSRLAGIADTATIMRLGGCFCGDCARLVAALAEQLGILYDVPLKGYTLGLRGHLTGLVETPLGEVLADPMLGVCYHTLDNRRLATLDEMRQTGAIAERMWALPRAADGRNFFEDVPNQIKRHWREMPMTYPPC